jgi:Na+/proline symporter
MATTENLTNIDKQVRGFFKIKSLGPFIENLIQVIIAIGSVIALLYLFLGGIEFITSGGNQEKTKTAKDKITQAIFGLAILAVVWILWRLVIYFLGLSTTPQGPFEIRIPEP